MHNSAKLKILHLEDNTNDTELVRTMLENAALDFDFKWVENEKDFVQSLESEKFDFILSDYSLPGYNGLDALRKSTLLQPEALFIFVSGTMGEEIAVETLKKGATDYVLKNKLNRLVPTMQRALEEAREKGKREKAEDRYSTLIESAREIIFTLSPERELTSLNNAFETETGWDRNEWTGRDYRLLMHPDDIAKTEVKLLDTLSGKVSEGYEVRILCKNGNYLISEFLTTPLFEGNDVKEILVFARNISERKKTEEIIKKSLKEKETLLKEIHHRVKNNLQIVSSLLRMQASVIPDKAASDYLKIIEQRVKSMALIHQQLYNSEDLSGIDFKLYVSELCSYLFSAYSINHERITLIIDISEIQLDIDTALPCGLIINELVTNAIKHAFPDDRKGKIYIGLSKTPDEKNHLVISDDGVGSKEGLNLGSKSSLGMTIVTSLAEQLEAELEMTMQGGTKTEITFYDLMYKKRI